MDDEQPLRSAPTPVPPPHWPSRTRALAEAVAVLRQAAEDDGELDPTSEPWPLLVAAERLVRDAAASFAGTPELARSAEESAEVLLANERRACEGDAHAEQALALVRARVEDALRELREARDDFAAIERTPMPEELIERAERELRGAGADPTQALPWLTGWWLRPAAQELNGSRPVDVWGSGAPELQDAVRRQLEYDMIPKDGVA